MSPKKEKQKKVYRLVIFEEHSLKEKFGLILTKANIFTYGGALFILIGVIVGLLFVFTPLKYFLPPVENYKLENQVLQNAIIIDSLKSEIEFRDNYFNNIRKIINKEDVESFAAADTVSNNFLTQQQKDSILNKLIERQQQELSGMENYDDLGVNTPDFYKPLTGVVTNTFDPSAGHFGIDIAAHENDPVLAALDGTVVLATWSISTGYIIEVQHTGNIITVYKHNGELLKKEGDKVRKGEQIALVGNTGEQTTGPHLHFEIWENGTPVNPDKYIDF